MYMVVTQYNVMTHDDDDELGQVGMNLVLPSKKCGPAAVGEQGEWLPASEKTYETAHCKAFI